MASNSGKRETAGERDDTARGVAHHAKPDGEISAHGGEENAAFNTSDGLGHNEPGEGSFGRNVQREKGSSGVECEAGSSHGGVPEQPTTTQAELRKERKERKKQQKWASTIAALVEALAQADTVGANLDTLEELNAAIVFAKHIPPEYGGASSSTDVPVVSSDAISDLRELLKRAEEKSVSMREEVRAMTRTKAPAENGNPNCVVCLEAPKDTVLFPCKHLAMCAECTKRVMKERKPKCPLCRSSITECLYTF
jgi:hypothetical protein